ncbi:MAG: hypothetical protein AAFU85_31615, partial [Planctomycetota bacterium]
MRSQISFSNKLIADLCYHPSANVFAVSSYDGAIALLRRDGQLVQSLRGAGTPSMDLTFSRDGQFLAAVHATSGASVWELDGEGDSISASLRHRINDDGENLWGFSP